MLHVSELTFVGLSNYLDCLVLSGVVLNGGYTEEVVGRDRSVFVAAQLSHQLKHINLVCLASCLLETFGVFTLFCMSLDEH